VGQQQQLGFDFGGEKKRVKVLSAGGGLDSWAMWLRAKARGELPDLVIFADVGDPEGKHPAEWPSTYQHLREVFRPDVEAQGVEFKWLTAEDIPVRSHRKSCKSCGEQHPEGFDSLYAYLRHMRNLPTGSSKMCTSAGKVERIGQWVEDRYPDVDEIEMWIGYGAEETGRLKKNRYAQGQGRRVNRYPLIEEKLCREKELVIAMASGHPVPRKSACVYCPMSSRGDFLTLLKEQPKMFQMTLDMEENSKLTEARRKRLRYSGTGEHMPNLLEWVTNTGRYEFTPTGRRTKPYISSRDKEDCPCCGNKKASKATGSDYAHAGTGREIPVDVTELDAPGHVIAIHVDKKTGEPYVDHKLNIPYMEEAHGPITPETPIINYGTKPIVGLETTFTPHILYVGPRGGRWADPKHRIHWDPKVHGTVTSQTRRIKKAEVMLKGGKFPIGTIRTWRDGKRYRKVREGQWQEVAPARQAQQLDLFAAMDSRVTEKDREPICSRPPPVSVPPEIKDALDRGGYLIINSSGGKDSHALTYALATCPELAAYKDRMIVYHADLGRAEWPGAGAKAEEIAKQFGLPFVKVKRDASINRETGKREVWEGDMLTHMEERAAWPSMTTRICTSALKTGPIWKALRRRFSKEGVPIVSALGVRRQEGEGDKVNAGSRWFAEEWHQGGDFGTKSVKEPVRLEVREVSHELAPWPSPSKKDLRAVKRGTVNRSVKREAYEWNPLVDWDLSHVWGATRESGVDRHYAYDLGSSRLSCLWCPLSSQADKVAAAKAHPEILRQWLDAENKMRATHEQRRGFWAEHIDRGQVEGGMEVTEPKDGGVPLYAFDAARMSQAEIVDMKRNGGKYSKKRGTVEIPKRYLKPFLEYGTKGNQGESLLALMARLGVTLEKAASDPAFVRELVKRAREHGRQMDRYQLAVERVIEVKDRVARANGATRERLLRLYQREMDQLAGIGAQLKGSHPFPSSGEGIAREQAARKSLLDRGQAVAARMEERMEKARKAPENQLGFDFSSHEPKPAAKAARAAKPTGGESHAQLLGMGWRPIEHPRGGKHGYFKIVGGKRRYYYPDFVPHGHHGHRPPPTATDGEELFRTKAARWYEDKNGVLLVVDRDPFYDPPRGYGVYRAKPIPHKDTHQLRRHRGFSFHPTAGEAQHALSIKAEREGWRHVPMDEIKEAAEARARPAPKPKPKPAPEPEPRQASLAFSPGETVEVAQATFTPKRVGNTIAAVRGEVFHALGTSGNQWEALIPVDYADDGKGGAFPVYKMPSGYQLVDTHLRSAHAAGVDGTSCQICGTRIKNVCHIVHHDKRIRLEVGSECVQKFSNAEMPQQAQAAIKLLKIKIKPEELPHINELAERGVPMDVAVVRARARSAAGRAWDKKHSPPTAEQEQWWSTIGQGQLEEARRGKRGGGYVADHLYERLMHPAHDAPGSGHNGLGWHNSSWSRTNRGGRWELHEGLTLAENYDEARAAAMEAREEKAAIKAYPELIKWATILKETRGHKLTDAQRAEIRQAHDAATKSGETRVPAQTDHDRLVGLNAVAKRRAQVAWDDEHEYPRRTNEAKAARNALEDYFEAQDKLRSYTDYGYSPPDALKYRASGESITRFRYLDALGPNEREYYRQRLKEAGLELK